MAAELAGLLHAIGVRKDGVFVMVHPISTPPIPFSQAAKLWFASPVALAHKDKGEVIEASFTNP